MKTSRYTEAPILAILRRAEAGTPVAEAHARTPSRKSLSTDLAMNRADRRGEM